MILKSDTLFFFISVLVTIRRSVGPCREIKNKMESAAKHAAAVVLSAVRIKSSKPESPKGEWGGVGAEDNGGVGEWGVGVGRAAGPRLGAPHQSSRRASKIRAALTQWAHFLALSPRSCPAHTHARTTTTRHSRATLVAHAPGSRGEQGAASNHPLRPHPRATFPLSHCQQHSHWLSGFRGSSLLR